MASREKPPLVSIVTPSFNQGRFIAETVESVLSQEGDFFIEYLVMDGGSTDGTTEHLSRYDRLLRDGTWPVKCRGISYRWASEKDKGQADAVNKGFRAARGEFLGWINSDDTYLPGAFSGAVDYLDAHPDEAMVYGEGYNVAEDGRTLERYHTEPFDLERLSRVCFILQPTVFLRRKVVDEVGLLDPDLRFCMDYEYWFRVGRKFKVGHTSRYVANFRVYPGAKTVSRRLEIHREIAGMLKRSGGRVTENWIDVLAGEYVKRVLGRDTWLKDQLWRKLHSLAFRCLFLRYNGTLPPAHPGPS